MSHQIVERKACYSCRPREEKKGVIMGLIRKVFAVGSKAIVPLPGVGVKFYSNGEAIRRQARQQTSLLRQMNGAMGQQAIESPHSFATEVAIPFVDTRERRPCPACAEFILVAARKCHFCGTEPVWSSEEHDQTRVSSPTSLDAAVSPDSVSATADSRSNCPHCNADISSSAQICKSCRQDL